MLIDCELFESALTESVRRLAFAVLVAVPLHAQIVVDVSGGPGAQFTQLQPAIAAANVGDTLVVRGGTYQSFVLDKGVRIVGRDQVSIASGSIIHSIPADQAVALDNLALGNLKLVASAGLLTGDAVFLIADSTLAGPQDTCVLEIVDCADVRFTQFGINPGAETGRDGVRVTNSRFAVDGASIDGASGTHGGLGLRCAANSDVHVAFSQVRGGNASVLGGGLTGGRAIVVDGTSRLAIDGTGENLVRGGHGAYSGVPGIAIVTESGGAVRVSRWVRVAGGMSPPWGTAPAYGGPGTVTIADPSDLALVFRQGVFGPSDVVVVGEPGELVALLIGTEATITPLPPLQGNPLLVVPIVAPALGSIANDHFLFVDATPIRLSPGDTVLLQAVSLSASGTLRLSNGTLMTTGV